MSTLSRQTHVQAIVLTELATASCAVLIGFALFSAALPARYHLQSLNITPNAPLVTGGPGAGSPSPEGPQKGDDGNGGGKGKAVAAGAGVAGAGVLARTGCRTAERGGAELAAGTLERGAVGASASSLESEGAMLARSLGAGESRAASSLALGGVFGTGGDVVEKAAYLEVLGPAVRNTSIAAGKSEAEIDALWVINPKFRAETIGELAEEDPESLTALVNKERLGEQQLRPISQAYDKVDPLVHRSDAIDFAINDEKIDIKAPASSLVPTEDDQEAVRSQVGQIVNEVMDTLPPASIRPTNAELRAALTKALKPEPNWNYTFNVQDGKLTLKYKTSHGEITGEPNIYKIVRKAVYLTAIGTGIHNKNDVVVLAKRYFGNPKKTQTAVPA